MWRMPAGDPKTERQAIRPSTFGKCGDISGKPVSGATREHRSNMPCEVELADDWTAFPLVLSTALRRGCLIWPRSSWILGYSSFLCIIMLFDKYYSYP